MPVRSTSKRLRTKLDGSTASRREPRLDASSLLRSSEGGSVELWRHIAQQSVASADRVYDRIHESCSRLTAHPELGRPRPDVREGVRSLVSGRWLIFYRPASGFVRILRVVDGSRDLRRLDWPEEDA